MATDDDVREWCFRAESQRFATDLVLDCPGQVLVDLWGYDQGLAMAKEVLTGPGRAFWITGDVWEKTEMTAHALASVIWFARSGGLRSFDYALPYYQLENFDLMEYVSAPNVLVKDFRISGNDFYNERFGVWLRERMQARKLTFISYRNMGNIDAAKASLGDAYTCLRPDLTQVLELEDFSADV